LNLHIDTNDSEKGTLTFNVSGEVDVFSSTELKDALEHAIHQGSTKIILCMSGVEYIDSTGLGVLINAMKAAKEKEGVLIIVSPSPRVVRLFDLTGVTSLFTICDTLEDANQSEATSTK
jgi:anti-sigma B factor antagonist